MNKEVHEQIKREMEAGREHLARVAANQVTQKGNVEPAAPVQQVDMEPVDRDNTFVESFRHTKNVDTKKTVRVK